MKAVFQALVSVMFTAVPALAEQKVFGEAEVAYGQTDLEDLDDTADHLNLGGKAAFVSSAGLGIQLGASYSNLSVKGAGEADIYSYDAHVYGDAGDYKVGAFIGRMEIDEVEIYGLGSADLNETVTSYGLEGQVDRGPITYRGYVARADIEGTDNIIYGIGADFDVNHAFEISADYDAMDVSIDGFEEELGVSAFKLSAGYYVPQAPVRLSAAIGRSDIEFDGMDANATSFGIGASYLFGNRADAARENLFRTVAVPF